MRLTLLEIVQDISNDIDGEPVNSIDDTFESQQIAQIVKSSYYAMLSNRNWPHLKQLIALTNSADTALPTHMTLEREVTELLFINYNVASFGETRRKYKSIKWTEPEDFLRMSSGRNNDEANVDVIIDPTGVELLIYNDRAPTRYTSFDDSTVVFDSYDGLVDNVLQGSKMQAQGYVIPTWLPEDDFVPDLPDEAFIALQEEAKSRAAMKLRQVQDVKAEQEAKRQQTWLSRKAWRVQGGIRYPNYGRRGSGRGREATFRQDRE